MQNDWHKYFPSALNLLFSQVEMPQEYNHDNNNNVIIAYTN